MKNNIFYKYVQSRIFAYIYILEGGERLWLSKRTITAI